MLNLIGCGTMASPIKTIIPDRPRIQAYYEDMLKACPIETQKEAIKHEYEWHGWADKLVERLK